MWKYLSRYAILIWTHLPPGADGALEIRPLRVGMRENAGVKRWRVVGKEMKRHSICFCAKKWQVGFAALDGTLARSGCKMDRVICCHILSKNEDKSASPVLCCTEVTQESTWPTSLHFYGALQCGCATYPWGYAMLWFSILW